MNSVSFFYTGDRYKVSPSRRTQNKLQSPLDAFVIPLIYGVRSRPKMNRKRGGGGKKEGKKERKTCTGTRKKHSNSAKTEENDNTRGGGGEIEEERKEIRMGKVSTSARCSRTIKLYESFPGRGEGPAARLSNPLRGILDDLAISIGTGEWSRDFGPPPTVPKGFERIERKRERKRGKVGRVSSPGTGKSSFEQHRNELS